MFDVGFPELILIAVVALLVIGPERLPETLRTIGLWIGRIRRSFTSVKAEIEREVGMDDIRRQLHNEAVMAELKRIEREVRDSVNPVAQGPEAGASSAPENRIEPPPTDAAPTPLPDSARDAAPGSEPSSDQPHRHG
jgi:sec-independent protein translocase protein TatB